MEPRLKIFSDRKWLPANSNHVIMLYPFWGDIPLSSADPDFGRFDDYIRDGKGIFEFVNSLDECDIAVLPFEYSFDADKVTIAQKAVQESKAKNKKLVIFFNSDSIEEILLDNTVVFRTSFFKSQQRKNEFAFPGWSIDFFKNHNQENWILNKQSIPKISYCGYVDFLEERKIGIKAKIKSILLPIKKESLEYGSYLRGKAVRGLLTNIKVEKDFIIRNGFWAQGIDDKLKVRMEYKENMFNSPYALVTRGAGNFSYRLIEVMSCGRIPVFINTDSVLPHENLIDWKKQTVWIEEKDINNIGDIVSKFHASISGAQFTDLQKQNRKIYEEYLSPVGFFKHLNTVV